MLSAPQNQIRHAQGRLWPNSSVGRLMLVAAVLAPLVLMAAACSNNTLEHHRHVSNEGKFAVSFPDAHPLEKTSTENPSENIEMVFHTVYVEEPAYGMSASYCERPENTYVRNINSFYDAVIATMTAELNGALVHKTNIKVQAYDGMEFSIEGKNREATYYLKGRFILTPTRFYYTLVQRKKARVDQLVLGAFGGRLSDLISWSTKKELPESEVNKFLDSFEFVTDPDIDTFSKMSAERAKATAPREKPVEPGAWLNGVWLAAASSKTKKQESLVFSTRNQFIWINDTGKEINGEYKITDNIIEMTYPDKAMGSKKTYVLASEDKKQLSNELGIIFRREQK